MSEPRRIEIETKAGRYEFIDDGDELEVLRNGEIYSQWRDFDNNAGDALSVLFDEVLAIGHDLDEAERAFRAEEERAGQLVQRVVDAEARAEMFRAQLARERARRLIVPQTCTRCGSNKTAPIMARNDARDAMGVIVVCCECQAFVPWRPLTDEELLRE